MFHLTLFSGAEAEIPPGKFTALVVFGGAELHLPTLAQRLVAERARGARPERTFWERMRGDDGWLIVTMFGGTDLIAPSLLEEYTALRALVDSGTLSRPELQQAIERLMLESRPPESMTFSLFAACSMTRPKPKKENEIIDASWRSGLIDDRVRDALRDLVGAPISAAARVLGQLATSAR